MEKPLYPSTYMRITQGYMMGTHIDSYAIDEAGKDTGISSLKAPFTGVIKKIYKSDANEVWLESVDKVLYPDGTQDYMTILFVHDNNVDNLFIGQVINKGTEFYQEGVKGEASGNHCHIECGQGKFTGTGWHQNTKGYWSINNGKKPEECLWIDDSINIINDMGYNFKKIIPVETTPPTEKPAETKPSQPTTSPTEKPAETKPSQPSTPATTEPKKETTTTNKPKLIFTCSKDDLYAINLKKGQKLYLE